MPDGAETPEGNAASAETPEKAAAKKPAKVGKTQAAYGKDQVQISSIGKDIQTVKAAVANSSDIRKDITEPIKAAIANGTYNVSNDDFASKLIAKYEEKLSF